MAPPTVPSLLECWEQRDLQRFRVVLKGGHLPHDKQAASTTGAGGGGGGGAHGSGLSGSLSTSAGGGGGGGGGTPGSYARSPPNGHSVSWGKSDSVLSPASPAEVNRRDDFGRTALHLVCASTDGIAIDFLHALLSHPGLNVNLQDFESGYTALHRALYAGNLSIAITLLRKADTDLRIKDLEGLTPFDLYNSTVSGTNPKWDADVGGSELFTWGVNRNFTLGLGDGDDRTLPKSVALNKIYDEYQLAHLEPGARYDRLRIKDVAMSKLHTVVLTTERNANVWICGFGGYTRLGRANQSQPRLEPLKDFSDCAASVEVAQDHTIIVSTSGDVYTFGQNRFAQLGYVVEKGQGIVGSTTSGSGRGAGAPTATFAGTSSGPLLGGSLGPSSAGATSTQPAELDLQVSPRKVAGILKREFVKGAAASKLHSVVFTADALYTWGTNTGQLGYDRAATPVQIYPRKVTTITAAQAIKQVAATEFATACLLDSDDVIVLHNDGQFRLQFPAALTTRFPAGKEVFTPRRAQRRIRVAKITSSGTTFAALSDMGDLFTFSLEHPSEYVKSGGSNVRPEVSTIWSVRRKFTAVRDVAIGGDGSIILSTESGHVFVRERRAGGDKGAVVPKAKPATTATGGKSAFKFQQIPYLQRVVKVATNESGGWAAIKADALLRDIRVRGRSIEDDLQSLLPHLKVREISQHGFEEEREITVEVTKADRRRVRNSGGRDSDSSSDEDSDGEDQIFEKHVRVGKLLAEAIRRWELADGSGRDAYGPNNLTPPFGCDMFVVAEGRYLPAHRIVFAARVPALREALTRPSTGPVKLSNFVEVRQASESVVTLTLPQSSFATAVFLIHYLHTNDLPAVWSTSVGLQIADQFQAMKVKPANIRSELLSLVQALQLPDSLRQCLDSPNPRTPASTLRKDMQTLFDTQVIAEPSASPLRDAELLLSDRVVPCHSVILRRSPFFRDLFRPEWTSRRYTNGYIQIDMRHLRWEVTRLLLVHLYTDAGIELFKGADEDRTADQFIDFVLEVLAAADEWALDKMKQVCSLLLRRRVLPQNLSAMMTDADTFNAKDLKEACMLQAAQTMESLLESGMLDELEGKQLKDLTAFVRQKQDERIHRTLAADRMTALIVANQEAFDKIVQELRTPKPPPPPPPSRPRKPSLSAQQLPHSPELRANKSHDDSLIFEMDDIDEDADVPPINGASPNLGPTVGTRLSSMPAWAPLPQPAKHSGSSVQGSQAPVSRSPPKNDTISGSRQLMTWAAKSQAAEPQASTGARDLRSIMESEKARRPAGPSSSQSTSNPVQGAIAATSWRQPSSGSASLAGSGAATPLAAPSSPSLLPINFANAKLSQKDRRRQAMLQSQQRQSSPSAVAVGTSMPGAALRTTSGAPNAGGLSTTPTGSPWKMPSTTAIPTSSNPISPLATRAREVAGSANGGVSAGGPSGGSPWKSPPASAPIALAPTPSIAMGREASPSPSLIGTVASPGLPSSAPRTPSKFSFAQIQEEQQYDLQQDMRRASAVKKSFAEIVEEERRIEEEDRARRAEAAEFERWFEQESRRVQEQQQQQQQQHQQQRPDESAERSEPSSRRGGGGRGGSRGGRRAPASDAGPGQGAGASTGGGGGQSKPSRGRGRGRGGGGGGGGSGRGRGGGSRGQADGPSGQRPTDPPAPS